MHCHILNPVESNGQVARIFNSYLYGLRSLEQAIMPQLAMAILATQSEEDVAYMGELLYRLTALNNSLHQLAGCLAEAYFELEDFATEGAELEQYARDKQREATERTGRTRKRLSTRPAKPQSLVPFQLHTVLAGYFAGAPGVGEKIGTSQLGNFAFTSSLLSTELVHSLRDPGQPAIPANLTTRPLAEVLTAEQVEERWTDYEVGLSGPEAVAGLEQLLATGQQAAALYHSLAPDDAAGFCQLYQLLQTMLDN